MPLDYNQKEYTKAIERIESRFLVIISILSQSHAKKMKESLDEIKTLMLYLFDDLDKEFTIKTANRKKYYITKKDKYLYARFGIEEFISEGEKSTKDYSLQDYFARLASKIEYETVSRKLSVNKKYEEIAE